MYNNCNYPRYLNINHVNIASALDISIQITVNVGMSIATLQCLCICVDIGSYKRTNTDMYMLSTPRDLTCLEDCPDVCVQNRGKWVLFWPQGRE